VQLGEALDLAERHPQNFWAQARAAHAQQQCVLEFGFLYVRGDVFQCIDVGDLLLGDTQPAEPVALVRTSPNRSVALPEPLYLVILLPIFERRFDRTAQRRWQLVALAI